MSVNFLSNIKSKAKNKLFQNSIWGVISNVIQNVLLTVFFIIIAKKYSTVDFGKYTISNTLYSFLLGFSSLGMGQWFIREYIHSENKSTLIDRFFKLQLIVGVLFYFFNIVITFLLYDDIQIRKISMIIGINLIFDNLIYVIKSINLAEHEQKKTFVIITIESFLKFILACYLFFYPIEIIYLVIILIFFRVVTLNLFIKYGSSNKTNIRHVFFSKVDFREFKKIIMMNWTFVVISSLSIINWRVANIIVSKYLDLKAVSNYEITIKLLMVFTIVPIIITSTIYPVLVSASKDGINKISNVYRSVFIYLGLYGFFSFTLIWSFSDYIIPVLFGSNYNDTSLYAKEMFLVILIFPTIFLQANVIVAIKLERLDMYCNLVTLIINVILCMIGLHYYKSLSAVNYSVFTSFLIFHIIQDIILFKKGIVTIYKIVSFYVILILFYFVYTELSAVFNTMKLFLIFWSSILFISAFVYFFINKNHFHKK